jgi:hypothetical protein
MANERTGGSAQTDHENVLAERGGPSLPPALRLQILTTEHWSLLSTRALTWNEAFSRATMFPRGPLWSSTRVGAGRPGKRL